jgi:hypothetical protein
MSFCIFYKNFKLFLRDEKTFINNFKNSYNFRFVGFYENIFFVLERAFYIFFVQYLGVTVGTNPQHSSVYLAL